MVLSRENLEKYTFLEQEIKRLNRKLDYYAKHPLQSEHGVVTGSMKEFPYAECHFVVGAPNVKSATERKAKVKNLVIMLNNRKEKYENMKLDIDEAIEQIDDLVIRQIIQLKYIERWTDEEIGDEIGYERSTISKKLDKFFENNIAI